MSCRAGGGANVKRTLESLREVPVDRSVQRGALATMCELAVAAQGAGIGILHFDQHLERLGADLGVEAIEREVQGSVA
jgi:glucose-6-phosphate isomerase